MPAGLIKVKKYTGVYYRISEKEEFETDPVTGKKVKRKVPNRRYRGKPERAYYISYRNPAGKFVREKVGGHPRGTLRKRQT